MNKEEVRKHIAIIHNMAKDYGLLDNEEISRTYQVIDYISNLEQENKQLKDKVFTKSAIINKVKQFCENKMVKMKKNRNSIAVFLLINILKIIERDENNK